MPCREYVEIEIYIELSKNELIDLAKGYIPEEVEDRWFIHFDGEFVRYYCSWTGVYIYKSHVVSEDGISHIDRLVINRDLEQYGATSDEKDALMFEMLVAEGLGEDSDKIRDAIFLLGDKRCKKRIATPTWTMLVHVINSGLFEFTI